MIYNITRKKVISHNTFYATTFFIRSRGMIGRKFDDFDAMVFERCSSVHTMFMSMVIDTLFIDIENIVCSLRQSLLPWRICVGTGGARSVIELPEGAIEAMGIRLGDVLDLNAELSERETIKVDNDFIHSPETVIPFTGSNI